MSVNRRRSHISQWWGLPWNTAVECVRPSSPNGYWQCGKSKSKSSKVRVGWPQTTQQRVSDDGEAAVADPWTSSEESKAYHPVVRLSRPLVAVGFWTHFKSLHFHFISCSRLSMVLWQCRPHVSSQRIHALDATTSISSNVSWHQQLHTEILFTPHNPPVEQPWQRICRSDYYRLLQESPALVRRRRSSTWYPTLGVCRLCSRSRRQRLHV